MENADSSRHEEGNEQRSAAEAFFEANSAMGGYSLKVLDEASGSVKLFCGMPDLTDVYTVDRHLGCRPMAVGFSPLGSGNSEATC